jgi:hypothetical protein
VGCTPTFSRYIFVSFCAVSIHIHETSLGSKHSVWILAWIALFNILILYFLFILILFCASFLSVFPSSQLFPSVVVSVSLSLSEFVFFPSFYICLFLFLINFSFLFFLSRFIFFCPPFILLILPSLLVSFLPSFLPSFLFYFCFLSFFPSLFSFI